MSNNTVSWLITGASRGLGLEIARPLLLSPSNIVFASCRDPGNSNALQELRSEACGELHIIQLDVTDLTSIEASAKAVESILDAKGLDYLVNNAGIVPSRKIGPTTLILMGLSKHFGRTLPLLGRSTPKVIVNLSSQLGSMAWIHGPEHATYSSCKAALNMFTTKQAFDRSDSIIFAICPGWKKKT